MSQNGTVVPHAESRGTLALRATTPLVLVQSAQVPEAAQANEQLASAVGNQWFNRHNYELALSAFHGWQTAVAAHRDNLITFFAGGLIDLYQKDRADRAASLFPDERLPRKVNDPRILIPRKASLTATNATLVGFEHDIPHWVLPVVAEVLAKTYPDQFHLLRYRLDSQTVGHYADPYIYARFGNWYVLVAQWDE